MRLAALVDTSHPAEDSRQCGAITDLLPNLNDKYRITRIITELEKQVRTIADELAQNVHLTDTVTYSNGAIYLQKESAKGTTDDGSGHTHDYPIPPDYPNPCQPKPIGIADYRKVIQTLTCYKPGEIAHIENVMKTETKKRSTRELQQQETTTFTSVETEQEQTKDLQTTDRYELQRETEKVQQEDMQLTTGVNFSASTGTLHISGNTGFAVNTSTQDSDKTASDYARSISERATQRILTKSRDETTVRVLHEFEENNEHGFDNTNGDAHVVGIYRWVNKEYTCRIVNYGKRLMFNMMVPEPGAFHLYNLASKNIEGQTIQKPRHPANDGILNPVNTSNLIKLVQPADLTEQNYQLWIAAYNVPDVEPWPAAIVRLGKSFYIQAPLGTTDSVGGKEDIELPDGYRAQTVHVRAAMGTLSTGSSNLKVEVAVSHFYTQYDSFQMFGISWIERKLPVSYLLFQTSSSSFNLEIDCFVMDQWIAQWRIKTYEKIIEAYNARLAEYNDMLARLQAQADNYISGTNPLRLRSIERDELKKGCIQLLTSEAFFGQFTSMKHPYYYNAYNPPADPVLDSTDFPWFQNCQAMAEGVIVQFFEMAFEWDIMSYIFHPYFWAKKRRWVPLYRAEDTDPIFTNFIEAGFAQVILSVRPGFEEMVQYYIQTGKIWMGKELPPLAADQYTDLIYEMAHAPDGEVDTKIPSWKVVLPTDLVILQNDAAGIDASGLPCDADGI